MSFVDQDALDKALGLSTRNGQKVWPTTMKGEYRMATTKKEGEEKVPYTGSEKVTITGEMGGYPLVFEKVFGEDEPVQIGDLVAILTSQGLEPPKVVATVTAGTGGGATAKAKPAVWECPDHGSARVQANKWGTLECKFFVKNEEPNFDAREWENNDGETLYFCKAKAPKKN